QKSRTLRACGPYGTFACVEGGSWALGGGFRWAPVPAAGTWMVGLPFTYPRDARNSSERCRVFSRQGDAWKKPWPAPSARDISARWPTSLDRATYSSAFRSRLSLVPKRKRAGGVSLLRCNVGTIFHLAV